MDLDVYSIQFLIFGHMIQADPETIRVEETEIFSVYLDRKVKVDFYLPMHVAAHEKLSLLLINDGQDLVTMDFRQILEQLNCKHLLSPLLCVGLHCSSDRKNEYGTARILDYKGRGAKASLYTRFVFEELMPFIRKSTGISSFREKSFAGFSLGGLSALDIVWNHASEFSKAGVFSGSLWWRDKDQDDEDFDENIHRIMHRQVREGDFSPWLKFYFEVGTQDETADRNHNGIIDAIDDTISLIDELKARGYQENDIRYIELQDGKHDVPTWARAFPSFLLWGWGERAVDAFKV